MSLDQIDALLAANAPTRLLIEADLKPIQGSRFQPTGFPSLGAAVFTAKDGEHLLVESAQSMANRLEATIWDDANGDLIPAARGLSYVQVTVTQPNGTTIPTNSITESHRLASAYILKSSHPSAKAFQKIFEDVEDSKDRKKFVEKLLAYDINSLLHGAWLSQLGKGRLRLARALSSFIEASGIHLAASGGAKNDHVDSTTKKETDDAALGSSNDGFGNVIFSRDEYTADRITAFFNLDLKQIRSYDLGNDVKKLLVALALFKVRALLDGDLRLRTACDLTVEKLTVTAPKDFALPSLAELSAALPQLIQACAGQFAGVTCVTYVPGKKPKEDKKAESTNSDTDSDTSDGE